MTTFWCVRSGSGSRLDYKGHIINNIVLISFLFFLLVSVFLDFPSLGKLLFGLLHGLCSWKKHIIAILRSSYV